MSAMSDPAPSAVVITPSDTVNFETPTRGIYVGVAGNISVQLATLGTAIVFKGAVAGSVIPVRARRVNSTGTTATDLVALY